MTDNKSMTREDLVVLLDVFGWKKSGSANAGKLDVYRKEGYVGRIRVPNIKDAADFEEVMRYAEHDFAEAEAPRLLSALMKIREAMIQYRDWFEDAPEDGWRFQRDLDEAMKQLK